MDACKLGLQSSSHGKGLRKESALFFSFFLRQGVWTLVNHLQVQEENRPHTEGRSYKGSNLGKGVRAGQPTTAKNQLNQVILTLDLTASHTRSHKDSVHRRGTNQI